MGGQQGGDHGEEQGAGHREEVQEQPGTNCIKIGLPGKTDSLFANRFLGSPILLKIVSEN